MNPLTTCQKNKDSEKNTVVMPDWEIERARKDAEVKEQRQIMHGRLATLLFVATTATFAGLWASTLDNGSSGASSGGEDSSDFTVLAGAAGCYGDQDGPTGLSVYADASLRLPFAACFSPNGDGSVIVADTYNHHLRMIHPASNATAGTTTTIVPATHTAVARYSIPGPQLEPSVPSDDYWDVRVEDRVRYANWQATRDRVDVTEMLDSVGAPAFPTALARVPQFAGVEASAIAMVAMRDSNAIYRLRLTDDDSSGGGASGAVLEKIAGSGDASSCTAPALLDGPLLNATFCKPRSIAVSADGRRIYVSGEGDPLSADEGARARWLSASSPVRVVDLDLGTVDTLAGSTANAKACVAVAADGADAAFVEPFGMGISPSGGTLFVADRFCNAIRTVDTATGAVATLIGLAGGVPGSGPGATDLPRDVAASPDGAAVYWTEFGSNSVRRLDMETGATVTVARGLLGPWGIDTSPENGTSLVVADVYNNRVVLVHIW